MVRFNVWVMSVKRAVKEARKVGKGGGKGWVLGE